MAWAWRVAWCLVIVTLAGCLGSTTEEGPGSDGGSVPMAPDADPQPTPGTWTEAAPDDKKEDGGDPDCGVDPDGPRSGAIMVHLPLPDGDVWYETLEGRFQPSDGSTRAEPAQTAAWSLNGMDGRYVHDLQMNTTAPEEIEDTLLRWIEDVDGINSEIGYEPDGSWTLYVRNGTPRRAAFGAADTPDGWLPTPLMEIKPGRSGWRVDWTSGITIEGGPDQEMLSDRRLIEIAGGNLACRFGGSSSDYSSPMSIGWGRDYPEEGATASIWYGNATVGAEVYVDPWTGTIVSEDYGASLVSG